MDGADRKQQCSVSYLTCPTKQFSSRYGEKYKKMALTFINYAIISSLLPVFSLPYSPDTLQNLQRNRLKKRRLHGEPTAAFQYLKGTYRKAGEGLFIRNSADRTRSNGYTLKEGKLESDNRKTLERLFSLWGWLDNPQITQGGCGCPSPGSAQGQSGQGLV